MGAATQQKQGRSAASTQETQNQKEGSLLTLPDVLAGVMTSALYTTATYPVHRIKILLQTQDSNPHILSGGSHVLGVAHYALELTPGMHKTSAAEASTDDLQPAVTTPRSPQSLSSVPIQHQPSPLNAPTPRQGTALLLHAVVRQAAAGAGAGGAVARQHPLPHAPRAVHRAVVHDQRRAAGEPAATVRGSCMGCCVVPGAGAWRTCGVVDGGGSVVILGLMSSKEQVQNRINPQKGSTHKHPAHPQQQRAINTSVSTNSQLSALAVNAVSGGLAGALSLALVWPFEFATVRMAADMGGADERQYGRSAWW